MMGKLFAREYQAPGLGTVMLGALNIIMDRLSRSRMAGDPADVLLVPRTGHIGLVEFDRAADLIALGEEAVAAQLPLIRESMMALGYTPQAQFRPVTEETVRTAEGGP